MTVETSTRIITAEVAREMLERNTGNRKVSAQNLAKVKEALSRGEWRLNGEAIKIASDGSILDGQHRLLGCAETGVPFETIVITGLDPATRVTMDSGKSRTPADALALEGFKNTTGLAAITSAIIRSERASIKTASSSASFPAVTATQVVERVRSEPYLLDLERKAVAARGVGISQKVAGLLMYRFEQIDAVDSEYFFDKLTSGAGLETGDPILALRNALIASKTAKGTRNMTYVSAIIIKAWNKFRKGEPASMIKYTPGGANPERFPEPI